jgi:(E)-4-hydroxy-3-methyl-but-2-enyl pyrophosphate reductase
LHLKDLPVRVAQTEKDEAPTLKRVLLANPRGFCAGVERAIETVEAALARFGAPVYVRRAIVHNQTVVRQLEALGAVFVQEIDQIPEGAIAILSAHGSARSVKAAARNRHLRSVDAICPLVAKVHAEVEAWYRAGRHVLLIGHQGHPEIFGTVGQVPSGAVSVVTSLNDLEALDLPSNSAVAYAVQTTFAARDAEALVAAIQTRFADCLGPRVSDICYATTNRQAAIEAIAAHSDIVLVAGDATSSNARRLVEVARAAGCARSVLISDAAELPTEELARSTTVGLTAAASTPAAVVDGIIAALRAAGFAVEEHAGVTETTRFKPVSLDALDPEPTSGSLEDRLFAVRQEIDAVLGAAIGSA